MMEQAIGPQAVSLEYLHALQDSQAWAWEYGHPITVHVRGESNVTRDSYSSIEKRQSDTKTLSINAAEVTYQPSKYKVEKVGLRDVCDVMITISMQDLTDNGLAFDDLEVKRMNVEVSAIPGESNGNTFDVREKARTGQFGNGFLYVSLGLSRR